MKHKEPMILSSFRYKTAGWELIDMSALHQTNLLVGENASGKTRTLNALRSVTSFLQMRPIKTVADTNFRTTLSFSDFEDENWSMDYTFEIADNKVIFEQLNVNGTRLLERNDKGGILKGDSIEPPVDKLTVQVRRDRSDYPEIETLMEWAESIIEISCSNLNPFTSMSGVPDVINPLSLSDLVEHLSDSEKESVIKQANELGYDIQDVIIVPFSDIKLIYVKEKYVHESIASLHLSSGMLRVLYLLFFLAYMKHERKYRLILIDDLGEGLDYKRATLLGKIVFNECNQEHTQLISSSNDSFLMDVVDISNWQILRRDKTKIKALNEENSKDLFDYFRMTGLSNFDLFSSDFIDNFLSRKSK